MHPLVLSGAAEERLEKIRERMAISVPAVDYATVWGLSDLYDWLMLEKQIPPHELGKAGPMFWAMLEWSGKDRMTVAAFLNAKYEVDKNLIPDPNMTWWERIQAGAEGILEAPARAIEVAGGPLSQDTRDLIKWGSVAIGGVAAVWIAGKLFSMLPGGK